VDYEEIATEMKLGLNYVKAQLRAPLITEFYKREDARGHVGLPRKKLEVYLDENKKKLALASTSAADEEK
jgi:hypothetical protein